MRKFALILIIAAICGCVTLQRPTSICDNETDSLICKIAQKNGIRLETAANIIMMANFAGVDKGSYTAQQSIDFMIQLKNLISVKPNASVIVQYVRKAFKDMSYTAIAGYMVISPYIEYINVETPITETDVGLLNGWLDTQISILSE